MLRDYQQKSIDDLYLWFQENETGDPCLELPTGSGKSHIIAALCKNAIQSWPQTRILMMSHVKELVEQNAEKMRQHWPNAPLGIYSAGMGRREIDQITFASIQSVRKLAEAIGHRDLILVDECHLISNKQQGAYRTLINQLKSINPHARVIGLTATPYRLGQGKLTDGEHALFSDIINPVTVAELVARGFLAPLKSKHTHSMIDTSQVKKRGGEFIVGQLESAADAITVAAIEETIARAGNRRHWLFFCSGVQHAQNCADELNRQGIKAACVTGKTPKVERARIVADYKAGQIKAITNADVLTTGFDAPNTDLIAMLRPTMSAALYVQIAGRGMRLKEHTDHCLVLDFAGNVERHGPIVDIVPPKEAGKGDGETPMKTCPECDELLNTSVRKCPECGYEFPVKEKEWRLSDADIMGVEPISMPITDWKWFRHTSTRSGNDMVKVKYYGGLSDPVITEYFPVLNQGFIGRKMMATVARIAEKSGLNQSSSAVQGMDALASFMNNGQPPAEIKYFKKGKFPEVVDRIWNQSIGYGNE